MAARAGEALGARWEEFDLERAVWTVPATRMKAGREHRVPLSPRALSLIKSLHELREGEFVFEGRKRGKLLSVREALRVMRVLGIKGATVHCFRSTFRDWAAQRTNFTHEVCEAALAHQVGNEVEATYRRGDLFEKRRDLMDAWEAYCTARQSGKVLAFGR